MTTEGRHHASGNIGTAIALAATAGFIDAFIYRAVTPVFVANMSGNLVRLGIATGDHNARAVAATVVALAGFLAGVMGATTWLDTHVRGGRQPSSAGLLLVESVLVLAIPLVLYGAHITYSVSIEPIDYVIVVLGATAMGIQAVALRRVGQIAVSTTYGTGAMVRMGEKIALAARRADRPGDIRRRLTIAVLGIVLFSYVAGAFLATSLGRSPALLFGPALVPLMAALAVIRSSRTTAAT